MEVGHTNQAKDLSEGKNGVESQVRQKQGEAG